MKKNVNIFEFPSNLDLIKREHEAEPGVRKLPDRLRKFGFHQRIHPRHTFRFMAGLGPEKLTNTNDPKNYFSEENRFCIDNRTQNGIDYPDLHEMLSRFIHHEKFFGIEITIPDPDYDENGDYIKVFTDLLIQIINKEE